MLIWTTSWIFLVGGFWRFQQICFRDLEIIVVWASIRELNDFSRLAPEPLHIDDFVAIFRPMGRCQQRAEPPAPSRLYRLRGKGASEGRVCCSGYSWLSRICDSQIWKSRVPLRSARCFARTALLVTRSRGRYLTNLNSFLPRGPQLSLETHHASY